MTTSFNLVPGYISPQKGKAALLTPDTKVSSLVKEAPVGTLLLSRAVHLFHVVTACNHAHQLSCTACFSVYTRSRRLTVYFYDTGTASFLKRLKQPLLTLGFSSFSLLAKVRAFHFSRPVNPSPYQQQRHFVFLSIMSLEFFTCCKNFPFTFAPCLPFKK